MTAGTLISPCFGISQVFSSIFTSSMGPFFSPFRLHGYISTTTWTVQTPQSPSSIFMSLYVTALTPPKIS